MASSRSKIAAVIVAIIIIVVVIAAVVYTMVPPSPSGPAKPSVTITSPQNGATITGTNVTITVSVSNFQLVNKLGQANVSGEGHLHYFKDVLPPTNCTAPAITTPGTYVPTINTSYTWTNVTPGTHMFSVQLENNNHFPVCPIVEAFVNVTVSTSGPPTPPGQSVSISLEAHNIEYVNATTGAKVSTITVPAGANVTVLFTNDDPGIPHNFAVYTSSAATTSIFVGTVITGVSSATYHFTAPSTAGTYFFRCDIHPTIMFGNFVVT